MRAQSQAVSTIKEINDIPNPKVGFLTRKPYRPDSLARAPLFDSTSARTTEPPPEARPHRNTGNPPHCRTDSRTVGKSAYLHSHAPRPECRNLDSDRASRLGLSFDTAAEYDPMRSWGRKHRWVNGLRATSGGWRGLRRGHGSSTGSGSGWVRPGGLARDGAGLGFEATGFDPSEVGASSRSSPQNFSQLSVACVLRRAGIRRRFSLPSSGWRRLAGCGFGRGPFFLFEVT